ncbi:Na+/H+ antiporter NhaA [Asticcacaulis biprosthecium]|uniref:Na+/H+ antiporter NhaA n=1 Tax=Asticcacaulis biprosthecium TaxID=76891 RepID=UPI000A00C369|nr:Na+/H+ antiporter NhaA [Asticcacaulis biprosthecium]
MAGDLVWPPQPRLYRQTDRYRAAFYLARAMKWAQKPDTATEGQLYGVCLLCGIGFTMSLYIVALAVPGAELAAQNAVKSGVVVGSMPSTCASAIWLKWCRPAVAASATRH